MPNPMRFLGTTTYIGSLLCTGFPTASCIDYFQDRFTYRRGTFESLAALLARSRLAALAEHLPQLPQIIECFVKLRRFDAGLAAGAVAFAEQQ